MSIQVSVRVRPASKNERQLPSNHGITVKSNREVLLSHSTKGSTSFTFDVCFGPDATQEQVFECIGTKVVDKVAQGYSASVLAYGQTGSGKSHTMLGPVYKHTPRNQTSTRGLIPRVCEKILNEGHPFEIKYYEIYNEKVKDLLSDAPLRVREHPQFGPFVDCPSRKVSDEHEATQLIELGNRWRKTASTHMNYMSSRSHAVFEMRLPDCVLYLVDLAGSERVTVNPHTHFERSVETTNINRSLLHLGKVINILSTASSKGHAAPTHVPYRDSTLTWLLKDSFGGNSCTYMISTVSPHESAYFESMNTLRYASKASKIVNCPVARSRGMNQTEGGIVISARGDTGMMRQMRNEIMALRGQLQSG
eukprot:PhM_4_TR18674/c0_g1_i2/m.71122/K17916/KIF16B, SNX23; kinesin family member 16B